MVCRGWPTLIRWSVGVLVTAMILAVVVLLLPNVPRPVPPSPDLFEPVDTDKILSQSRPELSSFDFIFRPVFSTQRRPPASPEKVAESDVKEGDLAEADMAVKSMVGSRLLGIFGSGEVEGAIVRLDNGQRRRLSIGDKLDGWTLQSVSAREIRFVAESGEVADLDMILSQSQQPVIEPKPAALPKGDRQAAPSPRTEDTESTEQKPDGAASQAGFTFESIYRNRYQERPEDEEG